MSEIRTFEIPLTVFKENNKLSHPQKCKIPQNLINFPASSIVIVKSGNRKFICRLYYLDEVYKSKRISYIDDSVEINPTNDLIREIKNIEQVELISASKLIEFTIVKVKLYVDFDLLDLNLTKNSNDFAKITKSIIKHYTFAKGCSISCNRYGISKINVTETNSADFGTISDECELEIEDILIEKKNLSVNYELGGLDHAEMKLKYLISSNLDYLKNKNSFITRPPCQTLLIGPAGCGKTSLIHHVADAFKCNIFEIIGDIFKPYPGETEAELQNLFKKIKIVSAIIPTNLSIILIENIEIFCPIFDAKLKDISHSSRIASLIYSFLDDISNNSCGIIAIATSSKLEQVNNSLRRSSRMGTEILIDMPSENHRYEIMRALSNRIAKHFQIDNLDKLCKLVAENTTGFVGADLDVLCQFVIRQKDLSSSNDIYHIFECGYKSINPSVMRDNLGTLTRSSMKLSDIGGMDELKNTLLTSILGPLKHPDKFTRFGLRSPSGILLYGPSGCAKTTIVKCLAGESKMTLISVSSAEIYSPYVGAAEKFIVKLFNQARMSAPSILFFDEIDTIVGSRSKTNGNNDTHMRILSTLLIEIDGFCGDATVSKNKPILIIGATNRPECIDDALLRPGRFDKLIHIPAPDYKSRCIILKFLMQKMPIANDVDIETLATKTKFFSGADLVNLCNEAALCAATRDLYCDTINSNDFENTLTFLRPSLSEKTFEFYEKFETNQLG